jgi:hypothetical protein
MKPGTIVDVANRGLGTVVYHGLDGYGIVWGERTVDENDLPMPEALLRELFATADWECVGTEYKIVQPALKGAE